MGAPAAGLNPATLQEQQRLQTALTAETAKVQTLEREVRDLNLAIQQERGRVTVGTATLRQELQDKERELAASRRKVAELEERVRDVEEQVRELRLERQAHIDADNENFVQLGTTLTEIETIGGQITTLINK